MNSATYKWNYNFPQIAREYGLRLNGAESGTLDWRLIGSHDIERLVKDNDFERLESVIPHLTEAPLGAILNNSVLDSGIAKYFCLAQLGLQYLSFCKDFLDKAVTSLRRNVYNIEKERQKLLKTNRKKNEELLRMHKKVHKIEENFEKKSDTYACSKCTKNFASPEFLDNHVERKHSQSVQKMEDDNNLVGNIKLELEIKQLKQKLNDAERKLQEPRKTCASLGIQTNFEEEKDKDESSEVQAQRQLVLESQHQLAELLRAQLNAMDEWKSSEKQRSQKDSLEMKTSLQEAVKLMSQKSRVVLNKSKLDLYSIPAGKAEAKESAEAEEIREWRKKYHDLEESYKDGHEKLSYILNDLDKKNKDQRLLIEMLKKKPETKDFTVQVEIVKSIKSDDEILKIPSKIPMKMFVSSITDSEDEDEDEEEEEEISVGKSKEDQRQMAKNKINLTLENLGIKPDQTRLKSSDFEKIKSKISRERSSRIRNISNFSRTRSNILDKLEDLIQSNQPHPSPLSTKISFLSSKISKRVNFK
ncbi:cilium assembly protein DZIP1L [Phlebotomus argentipes]|uniref:cilium assembly protein DZIP1L n=1 Tax=Phlebotomus argentipes TaxID=94469 RepID=UPI00289300B0|nr:cilium assembly protein DZIP1L [Phlebotomus argentipes]